MTPTVFELRRWVEQPWTKQGPPSGRDGGAEGSEDSAGWVEARRQAQQHLNVPFLVTTSRV